MRPIDDPSSLTPDQRHAAVANILAAGILRLQTRAALTGILKLCAGTMFLISRIAVRSEQSTLLGAGNVAASVSRRRSD